MYAGGKGRGEGVVLRGSCIDVNIMIVRSVNCNGVRAVVKQVKKNWVQR